MTGALQKKNDPAAVGAAQGHGSTSRMGSSTMNRTNDITAGPALATPISIREAKKEAECIWDDIAGIRHRAHFLMFDLEESFNIRRGKVDGSSVTLTFQKDGIDASLWMIGEIWSTLEKVSDSAEALMLRLEKAEGLS